MSTNKPVQLGLCCLNTTLRDQNPSVFCSRKMIIRKIEEDGIQALKLKIIQNLNDLYEMIKWNEENGIKVLRISSELFPHISNPKVEGYDMEFADALLKKIGEYARSLNHRLTFHPGQYNVVGTPNEATFQQTINDLSYHAEVLDRMGMGSDSVMVVHGGGLYGDKEKTLERWCENYKRLPEPIKRRLVLENCEKCFSIEDCLYVSEKVHVPVVFDTHHYSCYNFLHPDERFKRPGEYMEAILNTWKRRGIKPKFHVSEQGSGRTGHHSDYIEVIPDYLLEIPERYGCDIDIMIEAKKKELAIFKLYTKYPFLNCRND
jgi:UV DNA damage endonuclease